MTDDIKKQIEDLKAQVAALEAAPAPNTDPLTEALDTVNAFAKSALALADDPEEITVEAAAAPSGADVEDEDGDRAAITIEADPEIEGAVDAFPILKSYFAQLARVEAKVDALRAELRETATGSGAIAKAVGVSLAAHREHAAQLAAIGTQGAGRKATLTPIVKGTAPDAAADTGPAALRGSVLMAKANAAFLKSALSAPEISAIETFVNNGASLADIGRLHPALGEKLAVAISQ